MYVYHLVSFFVREGVYTTIHENLYYEDISNANYRVFKSQDNYLSKR